MLFRFPRDPKIAAVLQDRIADLSDEAATEFFLEFEKWAEVVEAGKMSRVVAILNDQYDICMINVAAPCPTIVGAFDPATRTFYLADLVDIGKRDPRNAVHACANALAETVISVEYL